MTPAKARENLERLTKLLQDHVNASKPHETVAPRELLIWFIEAANKGGSIDKALGLTRGRGRPKPDKPGIYFNMACQIFWKRHEGKSWRTISEETGFEDQRELQKIFERERERVIAHYVGLIDAK